MKHCYIVSIMMLLYNKRTFVEHNSMKEMQQIGKAAIMLG